MPTEEAKGPWQRHRSQVMYRSRWFAVHRDDVTRPDGSPGVYDRVDIPSSVRVLAVDAYQRVALTKQWIYIHDRWELQLPGGSVNLTDPDPQAAAARELAEETGLTAETWTALGEVENVNSVTSSITHLFAAHALTYGPANPEANEADLQLVWLSYSDAVEAALNGEIRESASVALLLATEVRRTRGVWTWLT